VRGLVRRTSLAEYKKPKPAWETVLDLDALNAAEHESWVWKGQHWLYPKYDRCLIELSRGGGDSVVVREFDAVKKQFVTGGFALPEGKSQVAWKDLDTVYVAADFGPGTLTASGYPRVVKEWKRGTPLADAKTIFEGQPSDVAVGASRSWDHGKTYDFVQRDVTTYTSETFSMGNDGKLTKLEVPADAKPDVWNGQLLVTLRSDWTIADKTWPKGALLAIGLDDFRAGKRDFTMLYQPTPTTSLEGVSGIKSSLVMNVLDNVHNRLSAWTLVNKKWTEKPLPGVGANDLNTRSAWAVDDDGSTDDYWQITTGFIEPSTLALGTLGKPATPIKKSPTFFDAKGLVVEQHFATSKDGTKVPYFQIARDHLALDGSHPTLLYGYGGFEISLTPGYDPIAGAAWEERGGVYVLANIRGGAEYGPAWHQAALQHHRQNAYDDFIAVSEDLIARKVTSTPHLGIQGGSNGGLLMGVMLTERPDLFGAVVCQAPLLDMKRYHKLLAGASWMEEYGDPEKADDWAAIAKYSPYQNLHEGTKYPRTLFTSSTRDDRVHPGHARKMVARMLEQKDDVLYYENIEGGHGGAADLEQAAYVGAIEYSFLAKQLGLP
jgi:prolyl oligopeptidase